MRIKQISVKKLFGVFNHVIPLNQEDRITIIHGPNGYGKTVLLRMIDGFFNEDYAILHDTPFYELRLDFTDESYVRLVPDHSNQKVRVDTFFGKSDSTEAEFRLQFRREKKERTSDFSPRSLPDPEWLCELRKQVKAHLVTIDRLQKIPTTRNLITMPGIVVNAVGESDQETILAVEEYAKELAENIQKTKAKYAEFSQELDRTFPTRLLTTVTAADLTDEEIQRNWKALSKKREHLIAAGLLENGHDAAVEIPAKIADAAKKNALAIYLRDTKEKLAVFDDLAARIDLFQRIIKQRFQFKNMVVGKEKGFAFFTPNNGTLSVARLSSGEQHELVLLYELLFKVAPDSLILIDEPELSLHVAWQSQFLKDLQEIIKLVPLDFLIATHSPDIISDRWDLTVELKGPQQ
jgi:predicted ATP-binding protein involved in virulence